MDSRARMEIWLIHSKETIYQNPYFSKIRASQKSMHLKYQSIKKCASQKFLDPIHNCAFSRSVQLMSVSLEALLYFEMNTDRGRTTTGITIQDNSLANRRRNTMKGQMQTNGKGRKEDDITCDKQESSTQPTWTSHQLIMLLFVFILLYVSILRGVKLLK